MAMELPEAYAGQWQPCSVEHATKYFVARDTRGKLSSNYYPGGPIHDIEEVPKAIRWMTGMGWHLTDQIRIIPVLEIDQKTGLEVRAEALRVELNKLDREIALG